MRKLLLPALATCVFLPVVFLAACGDDAEEAPATFDLALTIEGAGNVTSTPAGITCDGPKDCGSHAFAPGTVTLRATPGAGQALVGWKVDDVAREASTSLDIVGAAGGKPKVVAIFAAGGGGGGNGDAADAGADSGADAGPTACTSTADCTTAGSVCCVEAEALRGGRASYTVKSVTCQPSASCTSTSGTIRGPVCQALLAPAAPVCSNSESCMMVRDDGLGVCRPAT